ncbi:hypothetical protein CRUP_024849, partial [Coryphaenoides rupestris]
GSSVWEQLVGRVLRAGPYYLQTPSPEPHPCLHAPPLSPSSPALSPRTESNGPSAVRTSLGTFHPPWKTRAVGAGRSQEEPVHAEPKRLT